MAIDADLILRQARDLQALDLERVRAVELAEELRALFANVREAAQAARFDDEPDRFLSVLSELRDPPLP